MQEHLERIDRLRRRWRAVALALGLAHVLTFVGVGILVHQLRTMQAVGQLLAAENEELRVKRAAELSSMLAVMDRERERATKAITQAQELEELLRKGP